MSQENVEIVKRALEVFFDGLERGDRAAGYDDFFTPDYEWRLPFGFAGAERYVGRQGWLDFFDAWTEDFDEWSMGVEEVLDAGGDRVLVLATQSARGKGSGVPVDLHFGLLYELQRGRIASITVFPDAPDALRAAGLER